MISSIDNRGSMINHSITSSSINSTRNNICIKEVVVVVVSTRAEAQCVATWDASGIAGKMLITSPISDVASKSHAVSEIPILRIF